jgi:hypothetical protein
MKDQDNGLWTSAEKGAVPVPELDDATHVSYPGTVDECATEKVAHPARMPVFRNEKRSFESHALGACVLHTDARLQP